ncbi:MAG: hypothetical protein M3Z27_01635 [Actinomycetota bacterium]|nr:hypothetical protein [Actinomycetota bacterium]
MAGYPIEPDKLLDAADRLAPVRTGPGRPPYTAHRRAVSTAYYAVFHAITERVAAIVFPSADDAFQRRIRRWIGHGDIRTVARWVSQLKGTSSGSPPPHIQQLLAPGGSQLLDLITFFLADGFLELNDKREQADYDHDAVFTRPDTRGHIALAKAVVATAQTVDNLPTRCFYGLIGLQARIQNR